MASELPDTEHTEVIHVSPKEKAALLEERRRVERNEQALKDNSKLEEGLKGLRSMMQTLKSEMKEAKARKVQSDETDVGTPLHKQSNLAESLLDLGFIVESGLKVLVKIARLGEEAGKALGDGKLEGSITLRSVCDNRSLRGVTALQIHIVAKTILERELVDSQILSGISDIYQLKIRSAMNRKKRLSFARENKVSLCKKRIESSLREPLANYLSG